MPSAVESPGGDLLQISLRHLLHKVLCPFSAQAAEVTISIAQASAVIGSVAQASAGVVAVGQDGKVAVAQAEGVKVGEGTVHDVAQAEKGFIDVDAWAAVT